MNLSFFIAKRIYSDKGDKRKVSRPAIHIATAGVAIGLCVMILTVSVVLGFKHTIRDKVIGFGSHIQVENFLTMQSSDPYPICIDDSVMKVLRGIDGVKQVERFALTQGILKTDQDFLGMSFKGVGPKVADCVSLFAYHKTDAFPVDTWIEKLYREDFNGAEKNRNKINEFFVNSFGEDSGYIQQYVFYYKRSIV